MGTQCADMFEPRLTPSTGRLTSPRVGLQQTRAGPASLLLVDIFEQHYVTDNVSIQYTTRQVVINQLYRTTCVEMNCSHLLRMCEGTQHVIPHVDIHMWI